MRLTIDRNFKVRLFKMLNGMSSEARPKAKREGCDGAAAAGAQNSSAHRFQNYIYVYTVHKHTLTHQPLNVPCQVNALVRVFSSKIRIFHPQN